MAEAAKAGKIKAMYVDRIKSESPVLRSIRSHSQKAFVVVQDMFLTETAQIADVVLPAANAYEKSRHGYEYLRRPPDGQNGWRSHRNEERL